MVVDIFPEGRQFEVVYILQEYFSTAKKKKKKKSPQKKINE